MSGYAVPWVESHRLADVMSRPVQLALGDAQEGVSEGDGHQDAGVEKCRVPRHGLLAGGARAVSPGGLQRGGVVGGGSLVEPERACLFGQLVQRGSLFVATACLEVEKVLESHAAVPVGLLKRDGSVLEQLDEGRPAHAEEVGGLLRGEQQWTLAGP